jgi:hypothetical protein
LGAEFVSQKPGLGLSFPLQPACPGPLRDSGTPVHAPPSEASPWSSFRKSSVRTGINKMSSNLTTTWTDISEIPPSDLGLVASFLRSNPRPRRVQTRLDVDRAASPAPLSAAEQDAHIRLHELHGKPSDIFISGGERGPLGKCHFVSQKAIQDPAPAWVRCYFTRRPPRLRFMKGRGRVKPRVVVVLFRKCGCHCRSATSGNFGATSGGNFGDGPLCTLSAKPSRPPESMDSPGRAGIIHVYRKSRDSIRVYRISGVTRRRL